MKRYDVIVIGGGISGLSFAFAGAAAGRRTLVCERSPRLGGCIDSRRLDSGYWFEMGAHTAYNSYGGFIQILEDCGLMNRLRRRARVPFRIMIDGNIRSIFRELSLLEMLFSLPRGIACRKEGTTVAGYYSHLVGSGNYKRVLSPFLAAVPSQVADEFPATMLFKRRPRRKDLPRSFTMAGGLSDAVDALAERPNLSVELSTAVQTVETDSGGFLLTAADGRHWETAAVAIAAPPPDAAAVLQASFPELAAALGRIKTVTVESVGVVAPRARVEVEPVAGIVPVEDIFFSAVSRDTVPDERFRAFTFHFRPGTLREDRLKRISAVLGTDSTEFEAVIEKTVVLPSPALGHDSIVREIDRLAAESRLCLTGNYFAGLAIEDCVSRSREEFARLSRRG